MPLPKYHQIYLVLREQLAEGRFAAGLPGELALAGQFGVARITVRKALAQLAAEGLIDRAPGRGTVPRAVASAKGGAKGADGKNGAGAPRRDPRMASRAQLTGLLENIVTMGLATKVKVLECEQVPASAAVAEALQIEPGAPVQKAQRVRSTREGPLSLITTYVPAALAQGFGRRELAKKPILILLEEAGVRIGHATQTISARLADAHAAQHLAVTVGSALLAVTRLIHDARGRPVQWLHGLYRPDRYQYEMQLSRVGSIDAKVWVSKALGAQFH
ncbi:MAG: GntR family transcriptional regulator [Rubrivivax sp.]|nr:GntR family transcriptional regulator [Rubrivivax sp.]